MSDASEPAAPTDAAATLKSGDLVEGTIVSTSPTLITVDVGAAKRSDYSRSRTGTDEPPHARIAQGRAKRSRHTSSTRATTTATLCFRSTGRWKKSTGSTPKNIARVAGSLREPHRRLQQRRADRALRAAARLRAAEPDEHRTPPRADRRRDAGRALGQHGQRADCGQGDGSGPRAQPPDPFRALRLAPVAREAQRKPDQRPDGRRSARRARRQPGRFRRVRRYWRRGRSGASDRNVVAAHHPPARDCSRSGRRCRSKSSASTTRTSASA